MDEKDAPKAVAFEVTLKKAEGISPRPSTKQKDPLSDIQIQQKLDLAEERRMSLKSQIQEQAATELKRAQDKVMRIQEAEENKRKRIEEELAADLEAKEQNKKRMQDEKRAKFKRRMECHAKNVEEMNRVLADARKQLSDRITSELELAEDRRNKQLGSLLEKIKEHDIKISETKKNMEEATAAYIGHVEERHLERLENGLKNRQEQLNQLIERLKDHAIHVENVRKNKLERGDSME